MLTATRFVVHNVKQQGTATTGSPTLPHSARIRAVKQTCPAHVNTVDIIDRPCGGAPDDLPRVEAKLPTKQPRDVFVYFIHEGKVRAPAAAMALIERLGG